MIFEGLSKLQQVQNRPALLALGSHHCQQPLCRPVAATEPQQSPVWRRRSRITGYHRCPRTDAEHTDFHGTSRHHQPGGQQPGQTPNQPQTQQQQGPPQLQPQATPQQTGQQQQNANQAAALAQGLKSSSFSPDMLQVSIPNGWSLVNI